VTTDTLSPLVKCGAVDGFVRACISSLCSCNTERTRVCTSCNNLNRSASSCETGIDDRMLNNRLGGSSGENLKLASNGVCAEFRVHAMRCTQIPLVVVALSNLSHHSKRSNEEAAETCCSRALSVRLFLDVDWKTCSDAFRGVAKVSARRH
jgi:hypothetical protein